MFVRRNMGIDKFCSLSGFMGPLEHMLTRLFKPAGLAFVEFVFVHHKKVKYQHLKCYMILRSFT